MPFQAFNKVPDLYNVTFNMLIDGIVVLLTLCGSVNAASGYFTIGKEFLFPFNISPGGYIKAIIPIIYFQQLLREFAMVHRVVNVLNFSAETDSFHEALTKTILPILGMHYEYEFYGLNQQLESWDLAKISDF